MQGAEIGVLQASLSRKLLQHLPELFLWMIDNWSAAGPDSAYYHSKDHVARQSPEQHMVNLQTAFERTAFAADRRLLVRSASVIAARGVPNGSLDFVFIDADHTFQAVRQDIESWWPKVRPGGILSGHDYGGRRNQIGSFGVNRAVDAFIAREGLQLRLAPGLVWWVHKPELTPSGAPNGGPVPIVRVLYGPVDQNARLQRSVAAALRGDWARNQVIYLVAGDDNARWLRDLGAQHIELITANPLLPDTERFGPWYMKVYLLRHAIERLSELLYLDFDCRVLRRPDGRMERSLRLIRPGRCGGALQALNVAYRRPVCLPIYRDPSIHRVRQCLNTSVLYCRDAGWIADWLAAYEEAVKRGFEISRLHDETFLMLAIDKRYGVLDPATMAAEFEIPIAWLRRSTLEARAGKRRADAYFRRS
jgi:hypothetical protein